MSKIKLYVATVVFAIAALAVFHKSAPSALAAPAKEVDEIRNFDAHIISGPRGGTLAQDCRTGETIGFTDLYQMNWLPHPVVNHFYHFQNAHVWEGDPGRLYLLEIESPGLQIWEIPGCPSSAPSPVPVPVPSPVPPPVVVSPPSTTGAQQIIFMVNGGRFTSLSIAGTNQSGNDVVWQPASYNPNGSFSAITVGWWWTSAYFSFTLVGGSTGSCFVDTITGDSAFVLIKYTPGQVECRGGAGSAYDPNRSLVQAWLNTRIEQDNTFGISVLDQINEATDPYECMFDLTSGIYMSPACLGLTDDFIWKYTQLGLALNPSANPSSSTQSSSSSQSSQSSSSSPSLPPGVYVTGIRLDPGKPAHNQPVTFYITFNNATSSTQSYRWRVYIFKADKPSKSNTETTFLQSDIPVGTGEIQSVGNFKYGTASQCDYFFAQVGWPDGNNNVNYFNNPSGQAAQQGFSVCN